MKEFVLVRTALNVMASNVKQTNSETSNSPSQTATRTLFLVCEANLGANTMDWEERNQVGSASSLSRDTSSKRKKEKTILSFFAGYRRTPIAEGYGWNRLFGKYRRRMLRLQHQERKRLRFDEATFKRPGVFFRY